MANNRTCVNTNVFDMAKEVREREPRTFTIDDIEDSAMECIIERLPDLSCQVQAAMARTRMENIAALIWLGNSYFRTMRLARWRAALPCEGDLRYFVRLIRGGIRAVDISESLSKFLYNFSIVSGAKTLPSVLSCDLISTDVYSEASDVLALRLYFPKLQCLRISGPLSGQFICYFNCLEELTVHNDLAIGLELNNNLFREICTRLSSLRVLDVRKYGVSLLDAKAVEQSRNLEVLRLNLNSLKMAFFSVLSLPNLRILTVMLDQISSKNKVVSVDNCDQIELETREFFDIVKCRASSIVGMAVDCNYLALSEFWDVQNNAILTHRKLRWLSYYGCAFNAFHLLKYASMNELTFLSLRNWTNLSNFVVMKFVAQCRNLAHLDVTFCPNIGPELLVDILKLFSETDNTTPLTIYYMGSGLADELDSEAGNRWRDNKYLNFVEYKPPSSDSALDYIDRGFEFEFELNSKGYTNGDNTSQT